MVKIAGRRACLLAPDPDQPGLGLIRRESDVERYRRD
jgi:hypothetical protein